MKSKLSIAFLLVFFLHFNCYSQQINDTLLDANLYLVALKHHIGYLDTTNELSEINVEAPHTITEHLPSNIGNLKVYYLTKDDIRNKTKKGKSLYLSEINPITTKDELLIIRINRYSIKCLKAKFYYGRVGGTIIKFKYDCNLKTFKIFQVSQTDQ